MTRSQPDFQLLRKDPTPLKRLSFALALLGFAAPAFAGSIYFTGTCTDCSGTATARLDLSGAYVFGTTLTTSNIVDFVYNGTNLVSALTLDHGFSLFNTVNIPVSFTSGHLDIFLNGSTASGAAWEFDSSSSGDWELCSRGCVDFGTAGTWSTSNSSAGTPEPASWALFGGAVAAGAIRRRLLAR